MSAVLLNPSNPKQIMTISKAKDPLKTPTKIIATKYIVTCKLDIIRNITAKVTEIFIDSPYNLCINTYEDQIYVFSSTKARNTGPSKQISISLNFAERCKKYLDLKIDIATELVVY
jgi:hypothetical protein